MQKPLKMAIGLCSVIPLIKNHVRMHVHIQRTLELGTHNTQNAGIAHTQQGPWNWKQSRTQVAQGTLELRTHKSHKERWNCITRRREGEKEILRQGERREEEEEERREEEEAGEEEKEKERTKR